MTDERASAGIEHLQSAALEMIQAARAFLDVVEDVVADRDKVADVVAAFGSVAEAAGRAARGAVNGPTEATAAGTTAADAGPASGRVQHIRVS